MHYERVDFEAFTAVFFDAGGDSDTGSLFGIFRANWVQGLYVLPVGAALGYVAVKRRSVLPCIFMHLLYNSSSFVVFMLPDFCQTGVFAIGAVVVVSAAAVWYFGKDRARRAGADGLGENAAWRDSYGS